jgi:Helix-turn-helix domain
MQNQDGKITRKRTFAQVPDALAIDPNVTDFAFRLWARLDKYAGADGQIFPSRETLAKDLRVSEATIKRGYTCLVATGWITRRQTNGTKWHTELNEVACPPAPPAETPSRVKNDPAAGSKNDPAAGSKMTRIRRPSEGDPKKDTPPTPSATPSPAVVPGQRGEEPQQQNSNTDDLITAAIRCRPKGSRTWTASSVRKVLADPTVTARPADLVAAVLLAAAKDPATQYPGRLLADGFDGWHLAEERSRIAADVARQRAQVPQWRLDLVERAAATTTKGQAARQAARLVASGKSA